MIAGFLPLALIAASPAPSAPSQAARHAPDRAPGASRADQAALAARLAAWARGNRDADALLVAARILAEAGSRSGTIRGGRIVEDAAIPDPAHRLADEAIGLAPGDARIAAAAAAIKSARTRGFSLGPLGPGPILLNRTLPAGGRLGWRAEARGNEAAIVSAVGDGDSDIDLKVADTGGATICSDRDRDFYPVCRWRPARPAVYRIEIVNRGRVPSNVLVVSN